MTPVVAIAHLSGQSADIATSALAARAAERDNAPTCRARPQRPPVPIVLTALLLGGLAGCATGTSGDATGSSARALVIDQPVVIEGVVSRVDTSPMAYDGNALVVVSTDAHGTVTVHLPARRNLCKAQGMDLLDTLQAGDRLRVDGTATGPGEVSVCLEASHRLQRAD